MLLISTALIVEGSNQRSIKSQQKQDFNLLRLMLKHYFKSKDYSSSSSDTKAGTVSLFDFIRLSASLLYVESRLEMHPVTGLLKAAAKTSFNSCSLSGINT